MTKMRQAVWTVLIALAAAAVVAAEPTPPPSKCPSLDGEWSGDFDGSFSGTWSASFDQRGNEIRADASIKLDGGRTYEGEGTAGIKCQGRQTAMAGSGSVTASRAKANMSGSFSGISDVQGTRVSGTWWSGDLAGTWRGERVAP